jgi:hypothetical protein
MATITNFGDTYGKMSNAELLDILENPHGHNPSSVAAAKMEFDSRQLTDQDIDRARNALAAKKQLEERKKELFQTIETRLNETGILDEELHSIERQEKGISASIGFVTVSMILIYVFLLYSAYKAYETYTAFLSERPLLAMIQLSPYVVIPAGLIYFLKRRSTGWFLLTAYLVFSSVTLLITTFRVIKMLSGFERDYTAFTIIMGIAIVLHAINLFVLCRHRVTEEYSVSPTAMLTTLTVTSIGTYIYMQVLF